MFVPYVGAGGSVVVMTPVLAASVGGFAAALLSALAPLAALPLLGSILVWCAGGGAGALVLLAHRLRDGGPRRCIACRRSLVLVSEPDRVAALGEGRVAEIALGGARYAVLACPVHPHPQIFAGARSRLTACPSCGFRTARREVGADYQTEAWYRGYEVRLSCGHCGHVSERTYARMDQPPHLRLDHRDW